MQDDEKDGLLKLFIDLKQVLNRIDDLRQIEPNVFLAPFLEVIRTAETTGPLTSLALASVSKFLSYGLIGKIINQLLKVFKLLIVLFNLQIQLPQIWR